MKKGFITIFITFLFIFSFFQVQLQSQSKESYGPMSELSNLVITPGVVNAMFQFNCTDDVSIYIKWKENGTEDALRQTYTDPDDMNWFDRNSYNTTWGNNTTRWMFVRFLNESTEYYYEIYVDDVEDTNGTFTTLPRFTDYFCDEFLDDWYWDDDSSNIDIHQSVGTKYEGNPITSFEYAGFVFLLIDGVYQILGNNLACSQYFFTNWTGGNISAENLTWTSAAISGGCPNNYDTTEGKYVGIGHSGDAMDWKMFTADNAWDTFNFISDGIGGTALICRPSDNYCPDHCIDSNILSQECTCCMQYDTLGANKWMATSNRHMAGAIERHPGFVYGINNTNWITWAGDYGISDCLYVWNNLHSEVNETYGGYVQIKNGIYVNFFPSLESWDEEQMISNYLAVSRNGWNYTFVDKDTQIVPRGDPDTWDDEIIFMTSRQTMNDKEVVIYGGMNQGHGGGPSERYLGVIEFRKNGYSYVKPSGESGWLKTTPISSEFVGNFSVNGNFSESAKLNISVINAETGNVYSGFSFNDFDTITTEGLELNCTWNGRNLSYIPEGEFQLNFSWDGSGSGELYSYYMNISGHQSDDIVQFISINGGLNGTVIYNATPIFVWNDTGAFQYCLQIANDSSFNDLVINLTNICEEIYPSKYVTDGINVTFILPDSYALLYHKKYYTRIRGMS